MHVETSLSNAQKKLKEGQNYVQIVVVIDLPN